jgi:hypothetical protein
MHAVRPTTLTHPHAPTGKKRLGTIRVLDDVPKAKTANAPASATSATGVSGGSIAGISGGSIAELLKDAEPKPWMTEAVCHTDCTHREAR